MRRGPALVLAVLAVLFIAVIAAAMMSGGDDDTPTEDVFLRSIDLSAIATAEAPEPTPETILVSDLAVATVTPGTGPGGCHEEEYTIVGGDTPIGVAESFDITYAQLLEANNGSVDPFQVGQVIKIPCIATPTPSGTQDPNDTSTPDGEETETETPIDEVEDYTIASGDTPIDVANRYDVTLAQMAEINDTSVDGFIAFFNEVGTVIKVPAQ